MSTKNYHSKPKLQTQMKQEQFLQKEFLAGIGFHIGICKGQIEDIYQQ